jgi:hypothetical protein
MFLSGVSVWQAAHAFLKNSWPRSGSDATAAGLMAILTTTGAIIANGCMDAGVF